MSSVTRAAAAVVALLAVIGVVVVAANLGDGQGGAARESERASLGPSPAESTESVGPSATAGASPAGGDQETLAVLEEIEQQVIALRGLPEADIGAPDIITRSDLVDELERLFAEEYPPEEQERDNLALRALGLLEPDQDVAELQLELLGDQVLGFYDDVEKRMVVVSDAGLDAEAKLTYAHEYTHALQDASFPNALDVDAVGEDDRALARTALFEGDASVTMLAWAFEHLTPQELMEIGGGSIPDTTGIPSWMVNQLQFPYTEGLQWAAALAGDPISPNFTELDAAYDDPPDSTEQIIDLDAWEAREEPVAIEAIDLAATLGEGWKEVDATPIGQASIRIMLEYFGLSGDAAFDAADGWGGDRAVIVSDSGNGFAVAWRLAWDTAADATEFADAYRGAADTLPFPATVTDAPGGQILVVHASDEDLLRRTVDAAND